MLFLDTTLPDLNKCLNCYQSVCFQWKFEPTPTELVLRLLWFLERKSFLSVASTEINQAWKITGKCHYIEVESLYISEPNCVVDPKITMYASYISIWVLTERCKPYSLIQKIILPKVARPSANCCPLSIIEPSLAHVGWIPKHLLHTSPFL